MNYHNISYPDQNNGDGLRVTLWLSGCSHHCKGCQNSQTWDINSGIPFDKEAKKELFEALDNDYISGITFSGGDPLHENNIEEVFELIIEIRQKFPTKTIWLYTGYKIEELALYKEMDKHLNGKCSFEEALNKEHNNMTRLAIIYECDVLVDGRYIDELKDISLHWRGSSNQRVINVQESLRQNEVILHCD